MKRILLFCLLAMMLATPVLAQEPITFTSPITGTLPYPPPVIQPANIPPLKDALGMLANGLLTGAVLMALTFVFEHVAAFQALSPKSKGVVAFVVIVGSPVFATFLLDVAPEWLWPAIEPYWRALAIGIVGWAGSQWLYFGQVKKFQIKRS